MKDHAHPSPMGSRWAVQGRLMDGYLPEIVTVQLNITLDFRTGLYKQVCVLRDPIDQVELARTGSRERPMEYAITEVADVVIDLWDLVQTWYPEARL